MNENQLKAMQPGDPITVKTKDTTETGTFTEWINMGDQMYLKMESSIQEIERVRETCIFLNKTSILDIQPSIRKENHLRCVK